MKNIIKSFILFSTCLAFSNKSNAQLASDKPAAPVTVTQQPSKQVVIQTASSTPSAPVSVLKNGAKATEKTLANNPILSQGKEVIKLASDTVSHALPPVSFQTIPAKKSE
jgi:hypothetical protein